MAALFAIISFSYWQSYWLLVVLHYLITIISLWKLCRDASKGLCETSYQEPVIQGCKIWYWMMHLFNSYEEKMLMLRDFDLNSMQQYTDSLKDIFKQTMLDQEIIFRKQVEGYLCGSLHVSLLLFLFRWHKGCSGSDLYK